MAALRLTWIRWQVLEVHWLADLAVRWPAELHLDSNGFSEVSVTVGWGAEHDGHLPVDISLGERSLPLPGILEETHLDVLCRGTEKEYQTVITPGNSALRIIIHRQQRSTAPRSVTPRLLLCNTELDNNSLVISFSCQISNNRDNA